MKNLIYSLILLCATLINISCKSDKSKIEKEKQPVSETLLSVSNTAPFSVIITEDTSRPFLPALQSFVMATSGETWLMFAGRTNGMHDFDDYTENSFPHQDFNTDLYVCNANKCNSMSVSNIPMPYQSMFRATNLQHYQDGNDLYITGGYGENPNKTNNILEDWDTYDYMAKIDVATMMSAINNSDAIALNNSMILGQDSIVEATGGELYKMGDYFYLTGGHKFNGIFQHGKPGTSTQVYLNAVHRFKFVESNGQLTVSNFSKVTDGLADSLTQFRRRDLPVVTGLQLKNGTLEQTVNMFAGVFTSPNNKIIGLSSTSAFTMPIQINNDGTYKLDQTFEQEQNIYATANFATYDSNTQTLHSTLIGGIGSSAGQDGFTNKVLTINTPLAGGTTNQTLQDSIPSNHLFGAESNMVLSSGSKVKGSDDVFDISKMKSGDKMQIGTFYGGIEADIPNPGGFGSGKSKASNRLWSVSIQKN